MVEDMVADILVVEVADEVADTHDDDDDIFIDLNYIVYCNDSKSILNIIYRQ